MLLQGFQFGVLHKPGKTHQNVDALSRSTYKQPSDNEDWDIYQVLPKYIDQQNPSVILTLDYENVNEKVLPPEPMYTNDEFNLDKNVTILQNRLEEVKTLSSQCEDVDPILKYLRTRELPDTKKLAQKVNNIYIYI